MLTARENKFDHFHESDRRVFEDKTTVLYSVFAKTGVVLSSWTSFLASVEHTTPPAAKMIMVLRQIHWSHSQIFYLFIYFSCVPFSFWQNIIFRPQPNEAKDLIKQTLEAMTLRSKWTSNLLPQYIPLNHNCRSESTPQETKTVCSIKVIRGRLTHEKYTWIGRYDIFFRTKLWQ